MTTPRFDLVDIVHTLRQRRRFIFIVMALTILVGVLFTFIRTKKYEAEAEFFLSNPLFADRNYLFRSHDMHFVDFFAGDDDIDKIIVTAESDLVKDQVMKNLNLAAAYKIDTTKPEERNKLRNMYKKRLNIKRTEYRHLVLKYTDTDPDRAAAVANEHIRVTEATYRNYYNTIKGYAYNSISDKIHQMDSSIASMTDSLSSMRDKYRMYDIISPSRAALGGSVSSSANGFAVEQIQNIASVKDQLVIDRAKYVSLLNEFSTCTGVNEMKFIHVTNRAIPPTDPKGLGLILTVIAAGIIGFFFAAMYILLMTYYRVLIAVER